MHVHGYMVSWLHGFLLPGTVVLAWLGLLLISLRFERVWYVSICVIKLLP